MVIQIVPGLMAKIEDAFHEAGCHIINLKGKNIALLEGHSFGRKNPYDFLMHWDVE